MQSKILNFSMFLLNLPAFNLWYSSRSPTRNFKIFSFEMNIPRLFSYLLIIFSIFFLSYYGVLISLSFIIVFSFEIRICI